MTLGVLAKDIHIACSFAGYARVLRGLFNGNFFYRVDSSTKDIV
jgi:hypothetical protein